MSLIPKRFAVVAALLALVSAAAASSETLDLDGVVERPDEWLGTGDAVRLEVTREAGARGGRALAASWKRELGDIAFTGTPTARQLPEVWLRLPADLDLSRFTLLSFSARLAGPRHGFVHVVLSADRKMWNVQPPALLAHVPLDRGGAQRVDVFLDRVPPEQRRAHRWIGIAGMNAGRLPDEPERALTVFDAFTLSTPAPPKRTGWGVDPERIAVSRLGFRPHHVKQAFLTAGRSGQRFEVRYAEGGAVAFAGVLDRVESAVGATAVADFSLLTTPGRYRVHAGSLASDPFEIGPDASRESLELLSGWVLDMRCGTATGLHPTCHADDGLLGSFDATSGRPPPRRSVDVSGGWHDAGDLRTFFRHSWTIPWWATVAAETDAALDADRDGRDDLREIARWGLVHVPKVLHPDSGELLPRIEDRGDFRRGNYWTDGVRGTADDRRIAAEPETFDDVAWLAASAGRAVRAARTSEERAVAARALAVASERFGAWTGGDTPRRAWRPWPPDTDEHGTRFARWGLGALELYQATGDEDARLFARAASTQLLRMQDEAFLPGAIRPMGSDLFSWLQPSENRDLPELFLAEMLLALPDDRQAPYWRIALRRVADYWMKPARASWSPWSLPDLLVAPAQLPAGAASSQVAVAQGRHADRYVVPTAASSQLADTAVALQRVAAALGDPELDRLARRQVEWAFGANPFALAWLVDHPGHSLRRLYSFSQGPMPGAVAGFGAGPEHALTSEWPQGGEPRVHLGQVLLTAAVAATQPARFDLEIVEGDAPWRGEAVVRWQRNGRRAWSGRTDAAGRLPRLDLDGGERYVLRVGDAEVPLVAVSGAMTTRRIDLERLVQVELRAPEQVPARSTFNVGVRLTNAGTREAAVRLELHAGGALLQRRTVDAVVPAGGERVVEVPLKAKGENRAFIVTTWSVEEPWLVADATGRIVPAVDRGGGAAQGTAPPAAGD